MRRRKETQELPIAASVECRKKIAELWRQYEAYLPGNVMSYKTTAFPAGTLVNLTPMQFELCLQTLAKIPE